MFEHHKRCGLLRFLDERRGGAVSAASRGDRRRTHARKNKINLIHLLGRRISCPYIPPLFSLFFLFFFFISHEAPLPQEQNDACSSSDLVQGKPVFSSFLGVVAKSPQLSDFVTSGDRKL